MAKAEWGTKRTCHACGTRFYDLMHSPATCPKCGTVFEIGKPARPRRKAAVVEVLTPAKAPKEAPIVPGAELGGFEDDEVDDVEVEEQDEELIEDTSDLGEDEDDVSEIMEHIDDDEEHL